MKMYRRILGAVFVLTLAIPGWAMSIDQLVQFLQSSAEFIRKGQMTDKQVAGYLTSAKLDQRLDDRTVEEIEGRVQLGPKTIAALKSLETRTASLAVGSGLQPAAKPQPIPPPSAEEQAAILNDIREYALNYSKSLPDFICTQVTRRYGAARPGTRYGGSTDSDPSWHALDTLQIRLSYFQQKEQYKVILVNNTVVNQDYQKVGGSKSFGEFGSMLREIFEPATQAHFEWDHWGTLRRQRVMAFQYHVSKENSQSSIGVDDGKLHIITAYHGLVEVDPQTHVVLRVTTIAEGIPADFPVRSAEDVLDYDYQDLSGHTYLLPFKARVLMSDSETVQKIDEEFRLYRKYSADSEIKYDTDPLPPLPEEK